MNQNPTVSPIANTMASQVFIKLAVLTGFLLPDVSIPPQVISSTFKPLPDYQHQPSPLPVQT